MSFHPGTGLVYIPASESAYYYHPIETFTYRPGMWNTGEDLPQLHRDMEDTAALRFMPCGLTRLIAWDPRRGEKAWEVLHDEAGPSWIQSWSLSVLTRFLFSARKSAVDEKARHDT